MGLHITRTLAATLNLLLCGGLTYLWIEIARVGRGHSPTPEPGLWVFMTALALLAVTSTIAAAMLLRRRTLVQGMRWNFAVALAWFVTALSGIAPSLADGKFNNGDVEAILAIGGIGVGWLFLGWCIARYQRIEAARALAAPVTAIPIVTAPIVTEPAETVPHLSPLSIRTSEPSQPLVLRGRH